MKKSKWLIGATLLLMMSCRGTKDGNLVYLQVVDRNGYTKTINEEEKIKKYEMLDLRAPSHHEKMVKLFDKGDKGVVVHREKQPEVNKWDLEPIFEKRSQWEEKIQELSAESKGGFKKLAFVDFSKKVDPDEIKNILDSFFTYLRNLEKVYTYAHLKHDENIGCSINKEGYEKAISLYHQFQNASSWLEPSLLQISPKEFEALLSSKELAPYSFYLTKLFKQKDHILTKDKEQILSLAQRMQSTASGAFSALSNADLDFGSIEDGSGESKHLTQASYGKFMKSPDRTLRKNAFTKLHKTFQTFENTLAELIHGQVQNHVFNAKVRKYKSCLEAALKPHHIPVSVYHSLIDTVDKNIALLRRYISLRKKILGYSTMEGYDLYAPLVDIEDRKYSFEEACEIVIESVSILGKSYQETLRKGLLEQRWVDVYENKGKRSGAYSSGCYDSYPYILLNFQGTLNDVLTLSHEAGHSMNTYLSNKKQSYHDASYTIFVAEVASTFNEQLTYEYLYKNAATKKDRMFLLCQQLDAIRSTFFRQALFAEFELAIHEKAENHIPLTPRVMKEIYGNLCSKYYGKDLHVSEDLSAEYLRIPHFYYNFYVYQYSTGIAAALNLVDKVKKDGNKAYLNFLSAGGSDFSINLLKTAGVDMSLSTPVEKLVHHFSYLLDNLEKEFEQK